MNIENLRFKYYDHLLSMDHKLERTKKSFMKTHSDNDMPPPILAVGLGPGGDVTTRLGP